ncbi:MAG: amidohydrolase family protein, partial [bacterium]
MILLLKNIDEIYMNSSSDGPIENGYIIIKNNNIFEIGSNENKKSIDNNKYDRIIDCRGKIALPGLVNVHTHAAMSLLRGFADDLSLHDWLRNKIWPYEASLNADEIYWGSLMAI